MTFPTNPFRVPVTYQKCLAALADIQDKEVAYTVRMLIYQFYRFGDTSGEFADTELSMLYGETPEERTMEEEPIEVEVLHNPPLSGGLPTTEFNVEIEDGPAFDEESACPSVNAALDTLDARLAQLAHAPQFDRSPDPRAGSTIPCSK